MTSSCTVYRFFDAQGTLLYVGISDRPFERLRQHHDEKAWWLEIASTKLEHFSSRAEALAAELTAIQTEQPKYNVKGKNGSGALTSHVQSSFAKDPPVGWFCHVDVAGGAFKLSERNVCQGVVVGVRGDQLLVRLCSWLDGETNHIEAFSFSDPRQWHFYDRWDEWVDAGDRLFDSPSSNRNWSTREMLEVTAGPVDGRSGLPIKTSGPRAQWRRSAR